MGTYINIGNAGFQSARNGEYVDKSELIAAVNEKLFTKLRFSCVSRCRRFGKSMAAEMLCAYYDQSCDSRHLFADLRIASDPQFEKHLNKYAVIYLDISDFVTRFKDETIVEEINNRIMADIQKCYPAVPMTDDDDLMDYLFRVVEATQQPFFFIIDEWDAICREFNAGTKAMDDYVNWLRRLFKSGRSSDVFAGAYLTGILPIKKYKTESALNNFIEYSMVEPGNMGQFFGFTKDEVRTLAEKHGMDFDELVKWYDGYQIGDEMPMFNPNSVMQAIGRRRCRSYWASTGAFDAVAHYIQMNYEGLKDDIVQMLAGGRCKVNPTKFQNDMSIIRSKDDVLTVLIHLGYLSYDWRKDECYIPNIAYYYAKNDYVMQRELPTGKGFADIVLIPRKNVESPAIVLELKYDKDADSAISQIHRKQYPSRIAQYSDNLLLVGINYDKKLKTHQCKIENTKQK